MSEGKDALAGGVQGAALGGMVGGPVGAGVGGAVGALGGYLGWMPGTGGGEGGEEQQGQLARNQAFTNNLGTNYQQAAANYAPTQVGMVGVPMQLGAAAPTTYAAPTQAPSGGYVGMTASGRPSYTAAPSGTVGTATPVSSAGWVGTASAPAPAPVPGDVVAGSGSRLVQPGTTSTRPPPTTSATYGSPAPAAPQPVTAVPPPPSRLAPVGTVIEKTPDATASTVSAPRPVRASTAVAGTTQTEQTGDSRGRLVDALGTVRDAAEGNVTSAADRSAAIASDKAIARARGLAASVQGRSVGGAMQQSQQLGAAAQSEIAAQQMANRANEQAVARSQYVDAAGTLRQGDVAQATTDATLGTNVSVANAQGTNAVNLANAGNTLAANTTNATLGTNVSLANADRTATTSRAQGQLTSAEGIAANELASKEATVLSQLQLQAQQGNQDAQLRLRALEQAQLSGDRSAYLQALGLETTLVSGIDASRAATSAGNDQFLGAVIAGGAQAYAAGQGGKK